MKALLRAVTRNGTRFPPDFMFRLDDAAFAALRSQFVTSKRGRGGRRYSPYVSTEKGVAMLAPVLRRERAITVDIEIMRTFVKLREWISTNKELASRQGPLGISRVEDESLADSDNLPPPEAIAKSTDPSALIAFRNASKRST